MLRQSRPLFVDERGVSQGFLEQGKGLESIAQRGLERVDGRSRSHSGEFIPRTGLLGLGLTKEQAGIDTAESKRIRQRGRHRSRSGPVRNIVQIAGRIRMI